MEMNKVGKLQYLKPQLSGQTVVAGFTTRHEGVSRPPYNSLNLGTNTLDSPHNVEGNRSLLARAFGTTLDHFLKLECDGIVTNQPGLMIAICVADCVPVLLHDPVKGVIAALHAGWQAAVKRVL